jgi:hypothetical protein
LEKEKEFTPKAHTGNEHQRIAMGFEQSEANVMRKKFRDIRSLGRSSLAPFIEGEPFKARHERRKKTNLSYADELSNWCNDNGWRFEIKNDAHHWIFRKGNTLVEWWPSSAKLVKNKAWSKGIHCHDYLKVINFLGKQK